MCLICNRAVVAVDSSAVRQSVQPAVSTSRLNALLCAACVKALHAALCGERVSQMTRTYNDVEAVTLLLEEKERDVELAARIGQSLLERNKEFESRNEHLEEVLGEATEKISQLQHEVTMKNALLRVYIQDYEGGVDGDFSCSRLSAASRSIDEIHERVRSLEEENLKLTYERAELETDTETLEARERHLADDCVRQLATANSQVAALQAELGARDEAHVHQQMGLAAVQARVTALERQLTGAAIGNTELQKHLKASQVSQKQLTYEVSDLEEKYQQCVVLLREAQQEVRTLRQQNGPSVMRQTTGAFSPFPPEGSLAMELEDMMRRDAYPASSSPEQRRRHTRGVLRTARCVRRSTPLASCAGSVAASSALGGSCESLAESSRSSVYWSEDGESSFASDGGGGGDADGRHGSATHCQIGKPGIPGSDDLELTLRRLSLRRANEINEQIINEEDGRKPFKRKDAGSETPTPCATPGGSSSSTSTDGSVSDLCQLASSGAGSSRFSGYLFRMPEKLQIIKPMAGSVMLHQWQKLATPHLGMSDSRPGVQVRGQQPPEDGGAVEIFSLCDVEEDDDYLSNVGKCVVQTSSTYTYTTAKVLHPASHYELVTCSTTPSSSSVALNCDGGTTTFSLSLGLASRLGERGVRPDGKRRGAPVTARPMFRRFRSIVTDSLAVAAPDGIVARRGEGDGGRGEEQGLNSIAELRSPKRDVARDVGLNTIMEMRRDTGTRPAFLLAKHAVAALPRRPIKRLARPRTLGCSRAKMCDPCSSLNVFRPMHHRAKTSPNMPSPCASLRVTTNSVETFSGVESCASTRYVNAASPRNSTASSRSNSVAVSFSGLVSTYSTPRCSVVAPACQQAAQQVRPVVPTVVVTPTSDEPPASPLSLDSSASAILKHLDSLNITAHRRPPANTALYRHTH